MVVYFYSTVVPGFYSLLLLGSNLFPTLCFSVLLGSYSVHIILCTKLCWFCAFIFIKPTIKKTKRNKTTQKNPYYKIIIIEALNKKDKQKIEKHICFLFFPLSSYILFHAWKSGPLSNCKKKWIFMVNNYLFFFWPP